MLTDLQKKTAQGIIQIYETGSIGKNSYGSVTFDPRDAGRLTFGLHQTTLASGNLYLLMKAYVEAAGAEFAGALKPWLAYFATKNIRCDTDKNLHALLRSTGQDPVMCAVQDDFFERIYWDRAEAAAKAMGLTQPLSFSVVYDSFIHGQWAKIRDVTAINTKLKSVKNITEEKRWIISFVNARRVWLGGSTNSLLAATTYRMDAFKKIIDSDNWSLALPLKVRGVTISEDSFDTPKPIRASADDDTAPRVLLYTNPPMQGVDVAVLKSMLLKAGALTGKTMGNQNIFDAATSAAVKTFQQNNKLKADGIVGPLTLDKIKAKYA